MIKPIRASKCVIGNKVEQSVQWATDRFVLRDDEKLFLPCAKSRKMLP